MEKTGEVKKNAFESSALACYQPVVLADGSRYAVCPVCRARLTSLKNMEAHVRRHFERHVCPTCSATFRAARDLRAHRELHVAVPVMCPECGLSFRSKAVYRAHKARKHRGGAAAGAADDGQGSGSGADGQPSGAAASVGGALGAVHSSVTGAPKTRCGLCGKSMRTDSLKRHFVQQHHVTSETKLAQLLRTTDS